MLKLTDDFSQIALDFVPCLDELQTSKMPAGRMLKRRLKAKYTSALKRESLRDFLKSFPEPGEQYHIISDGKYDYWTYIPVLLEMIGYADEYYGSTWTLNRNNCGELFELYDNKLIKKITFMTGIFFKKRETSVYATLVEGLNSRGQRYICFENHAKVTLLANHKDNIYLVLEGSANYTSNPRLEQTLLANDEWLYLFHKGWMEEMFDRHKKKR